MIFDYEWDPAKAASNLQKHGVSFEEAATVFELGLILTVEDVAHSEDEDRLVSIGTSHQGKVLVVSHTE